MKHIGPDNKVKSNAKRAMEQALAYACFGGSATTGFSTTVYPIPLLPGSVYSSSAPTRTQQTHMSPHQTYKWRGGGNTKK